MSSPEARMRQSTQSSIYPRKLDGRWKLKGKRVGKRVTSSFDGSLRVPGPSQSVSLLAWKRVVASEISEAMKEAGIGKTAMARRMKTSRTQIERLLDPDNPSVLLETIQKAAWVVGKRVVIGLEDAPELSAKARAADKPRR